MIRPNGNIATRRPRGTVAYDWPEIAGAQVLVRRGTGQPADHPDAELVVATFDGHPLDVADYLVGLADTLAEVAGIRRCSGCGFHFDPTRAEGDPARRAADETDCGRCVE